MSQESESANDADKTRGTPEKMSLTVKLLGEEWIVENPLGKSVGSASTREAAIGLARQAANAEKASSIGVQGADGTMEYSVRV